MSAPFVVINDPAELEALRLACGLLLDRDDCRGELRRGAVRARVAVIEAQLEVERRVRELVPTLGEWPRI